MNYINRANELKDEMIAHRRFFHTNAEIGLDMPLGVEYVENELKKIGLKPERCGCGVTALIGSGDPVLLLRADMDALPMEEKSGLDFASITGNTHACGHDFHAAMLLGAAKMLKENEKALKGTVKLMFQPGEEILKGGENMVENGVLKDPVPQAALSFHIGPEGTPGDFFAGGSGAMMLSCSSFEITVHGKGGHSGYPHKAVNPLNAAVQIYTGLSQLRAYETDPESMTVLTVGSLCGGTEYNIIPEKAVIKGSLRTSTEEVSRRINDRIKEMSQGIAESFGCTCDIKMLTDNPPLICNTELSEKMAGYITEIMGREPAGSINSSGSDDFACVTSRVPGAYFFLCAGTGREKNMSHSPDVIFNEDVLPLGAACYCFCSEKWLKENDI